MKLIKRIIALVFLYVPVLIKDGMDALCAFLRRNSKSLGIDYLELFFLHRYHIGSFKPLQYKESIKVLWRKKGSDWIRADRAGRLFLVKSRMGKCVLFLQNLFSLGAFNSRLRRALYLNLLSACVEFLNPMSRKIFESYMERKLALFERLLTHIEKVNGRPFSLKQIRSAIHVYHHLSLYQQRVIKQIKQACRRQGVPLIVKQAQEGMEAGLYPVIVPEGRSGSYWMRSREKEVLGIFKPFDEECFAINNPGRNRAFVAFGRRKMRPGVEVGEAAHNEVAAYQLDAFFGFGVVPRTYYACFTHRAFYSIRQNLLVDLGGPKKKYGSFQQFLDGFVPFPHLPLEDHKLIPLDDYQTILLFDLLAGNSDRHMNNLLVGEDKLAAIDHGLCFSDRVPEMTLGLWRGLAHSIAPFHPEIKKLVNHFPFEQLSWKLRKNCFRKMRSMERMHERLALFRAMINAEMTPIEMSILLTPENLFLLADLGGGVEAKAEEIVADFLPNREKLTQPPWSQRWLHGM